MRNPCGRSRPGGCSAVDTYPSEEARVQHLQMIQDVIARLGNDGFLIKGSAVTVASGFLGFAVSSDNWGLAVAALAPIGAFWALDGLFLRAERLFRKLFDLVRDGDPGVTPFFMSAPDPTFVSLLEERGKAPDSWWSAMWRQTLRTFYGGLALAAGSVALLLHCA